MCYETSKTEKKVQTVRIIYCGDVVARAGRDAVLNNLSKLRERYKPDAVIVNIENAAHGFGASPSICRQFLMPEWTLWLPEIMFGSNAI